MKLPGTEAWSDDSVETALTFADNLRIATFRIGATVAEKNLPGGSIVTSGWHPTDLFYALADASALAFATGRVGQGLQIAASLARFDGPPPRPTLMQTIFAATLGAIAGTIDIEMFEDEVTIVLGERRAFVSLDLSEHPLIMQRRLTDLIIPAAFASPSFLNEIHGLQVDGFQFRPREALSKLAALQSPLSRFAQLWKMERRMDQALLAADLNKYEGYVDALRADEKAWGIIEWKGPLIDWPLLATLVGMHRFVETTAATDLVMGPATRFLHDLARAIASERFPTDS